MSACVLAHLEFWHVVMFLHSLSLSLSRCSPFVPQRSHGHIFCAFGHRLPCTFSVLLVSRPELAHFAFGHDGMLWHELASYETYNPVYNYP